jgi:hypothetical protein
MAWMIHVSGIYTGALGEELMQSSRGKMFSVCMGEDELTLEGLHPPPTFASLSLE